MGEQTLGGHKQNLVCTRTQEKGAATPQETDPDLLMSVQEGGGVGQQWPAAGARALGATDLGMAKGLLEEIAINPTIEPPELTQDWGNRLLEGTNENLCVPGPRRKEQRPHKRLTQICP